MAAIIGSQEMLYVYGQTFIAEYDKEQSYPLRDSNASVRQSVDGNGNLISASTYKPFGDTLAESGTYESLFGFMGAQVDRLSGLLYVGGRYYDPATGRYLTPDLNFDPLRPSTLNPYAPSQGPWWLLLPLVGIVFAWKGRRRGGPWRVLLLVVIVGVGMSLVSCTNTDGDGIIKVVTIPPSPDSGDTQTPTPPTTPTSQPTSTQTSTPTETSTSTPTSTFTPPPPAPTITPTPEIIVCPEPPTPTATRPPISNDDVIQTAIAAVGEVGKELPESQKPITDDGITIVSYIWGDAESRNIALSAVSWVVRNRFDSDERFTEGDIDVCSISMAMCAKASAFQGRYRGDMIGYFPNENEKTVAKRALEKLVPDRTNGAVFFHSFLERGPNYTGRGGKEGQYLSRVINLEVINQSVKDWFTEERGLPLPEEKGFYFFNTKQWNYEF